MTRRHEWLERLIESRLAWLTLLIIVAAVYYGSYFMYGINFRDEGGTIALVAQRLLEGERPFKEVVLGYNVMWFYPVVALFKVVGVHFVLMRAYFLALSALAAVLAFFAVEKVSRRPWFAFLVALLPLLVPGMTFKNYMPLLAIANTLCLLHVALAPLNTREIAIKTVIGGAVLGLTFLIRIDLGIFFSVLWLGLHLLRTLDCDEPWKRRLLAAAAGIAIVGGTAWIVHLPVLVDARNRGFEREFVGQYTAWVESMREAARYRLARLKASKRAPTPAPRIAAETPATATVESAHSWNREILQRSGLREFRYARNKQQRAFVVLTYVPLLVIIPLVLWATVALVQAAFSDVPHTVTRPLAALVVLGGALTTFPQFFFFRPDPPHLSEFSPGYWVGTFCAAILLGSSRRDFHSDRRFFAGLILLVLTAHAGYYLWRMLPDRWVGTIAVKKGRTKYFRGENGVRIFVTRREMEGLNTIHGLIREHSKPGEYLVAYPYHPAFNVLSNRPTYEKNVYVDNATRTKNWDNEAIARFKKFKPAVIILSDWDINGNEASRFSVWATKTKTWIETHYVYQGTWMEWYEVYTRPKTHSE